MLSKSLNALAGIFVFLRWKSRIPLSYAAFVSQCPRGHFCFPTYIVGDEDDNTSTVSMPSRAFLFSYLTAGLHSRTAVPEASQCPRGHFCFPTKDSTGRNRLASQSLNALAGIFVFLLTTP